MAPFLVSWPGNLLSSQIYGLWPGLVDAILQLHSMYERSVMSRENISYCGDLRRQLSASFRSSFLLPENFKLDLRVSAMPWSLDETGLTDCAPTSSGKSLSDRRGSKFRLSLSLLRFCSRNLFPDVEFSRLECSPFIRLAPKPDIN